MYKTKPKTWEHITFWLLVIIMGFLIASKEIREAEELVLKVGIIFMLMFLVLYFLEIYISHTAFLENQIIHCSMLGKKTIRDYSQIDRLYLGSNCYLIIFNDGLSIKVFNHRATFIAIYNLINENLGRKIPYDTFFTKPKLQHKISSFKTTQWFFTDEKTKRRFFRSLR